MGAKSGRKCSKHPAVGRCCCGFMRPSMSKQHQKQNGADHAPVWGQRKKLVGDESLMIASRGSSARNHPQVVLKVSVGLLAGAESGGAKGALAASGSAAKATREAKSWSTEVRAHLILLSCPRS